MRDGLRHNQLQLLYYYAGFVILSLVTLILYLFTAYDVWLIGKLGELPVVIGLVGLVYGLFSHYKEIKLNYPGESISIKKSIYKAIAILLGTFVTYHIHVQLGLGAVVSAALVAIVASMVIPSYGVPIYCGAFVGMTSVRLLANFAELSLASLVVVVLFNLAEHSFKGFGGKFGTIAFCGSFITSLGLKRSFEISPLPENEVIISIVVCSLAATYFTRWLNVERGHGPVLSSGITGIIVGLILPNVFQGTTGTTLAVMAMCASFAGMSGKERIASKVEVVILGLLTGTIYIYSMPIAGGAGGKLGAIAFGATVTVYSWKIIFIKIKNKLII